MSAVRPSRQLASQLPQDDDFLNAIKSYRHPEASREARPRRTHDRTAAFRLISILAQPVSLNPPYRLPGALEAAYDEREDMDYELVEVAGENEWRDYHAIRREVLWEAQGRTGYNDR